MERCDVQLRVGCGRVVCGAKSRGEYGRVGKAVG